MTQPKISEVHKQMAKEVMKKMRIKSIDELVEILIQEKYNSTQRGEMNNFDWLVVGSAQRQR